MMKLTKHLWGHVSPWLIFLWVAVAWKLVFAYWTLFIQHYLVPPGDDAAVHIGQIQDVLNGHWVLIGSNGYPRGFHLVMALIAKLAGLGAFQTVLQFTPLLLVIPIVVVYFVAKGFFKSTLAGVVAGCAWAFMALAPVRALGDGNYPDILAGSILLPLCLLSLYRFILSPKPARLIPVVVYMLLIAFTHHLSFVYIIVIIAPWLSIIVGEKMWEYRRHKKALRMAMASVLALLGVVGFFLLLYGRILEPFVQTVRQGGNLTQYLGGDSSTISLSKVLEINDGLFVILGLVGMLLLLFSKQERYLKLLLASWVLTLLALGTVPAIGLPGRFVRELAVPFSLLIGFTFQLLYTHTLPKWRNLFIPILVTMLFTYSLITSYNQPFALPGLFQPIMRMQHEEEAAIPIINNANTDTVIMNNSNPFMPYVVQKNVIIVTDPAQTVLLVSSHPHALLYLAQRPPLSVGYPFFAGYDEVTASLNTVPNKKLIATLTNGSTIYQLTDGGTK